MSKNWKSFLAKGESFIPGNETQLKLGLIALILNKNVLIEDVPGVGKTTFVKYFVRSTGLIYKRIQFTSDLLPSDILGSQIFQKHSEEFIFRPGPIFSELILADELNRGSPKTQSALLEAMEEKMVTIDEKSYPLSQFFSVFATQNPRSQFGTYPLPESQLDRFLFKFSMGRLSREEEVHLLKSPKRFDLINDVSVSLIKDELALMRDQLSQIYTSDEVLYYLRDLVQETRNSQDWNGLSIRASFDLLEASKAWAFLNEKDFLSVQDIQDVFPYVSGHRLFSSQSLSFKEEFLRAKDFVSKVKFFN